MERVVGKAALSAGVAHAVPADLQAALCSDSEVVTLWEGLSAIGRNEWICWVEQAKKPLTRSNRIGRVCSELKQGVRRPCCWPGCPHRSPASKGR
jgi:uncharacterized protein YdeI (YjbR/CyaY-like superfamily)